MLEEYKRKRDFAVTPEPRAHEAREQGNLKFVIQKHSARRLHYDFRLEIDGVLVSWAVPKGPSLNPADKRLAVQTEDHPLDYASFEGNIPKGEYGGGPVIIWDEGTYSPDHDGKTSWGNREEALKRLREGLRKGKISVFLKGDKLHGSWTLFRLHNTEKDWILLKHKDEFAQPRVDITKEDRSVVSGRTIEEIRTGKPAAHPLLDAKKAGGAKSTSKFPSDFTPMLATLADGAFDSPGWIYEPKMDGIRAVALIRKGVVTLLSRRGLDLTLSYPGIVRELEAYKEDIIFDGEIVALDAKGRPSFQLLQQRSGLTRPTDVKSAEQHVPVVFYVFDLLHLGKYSLEGVVLRDRKVLLKQTLVSGERIRLIDRIETDGFTAFEACVEGGLEGLVAKRLDSIYEPGRRSRGWLKVKAALTSDLVICGYTEGTGSRASTFGSLILGYYNDDGELTYAGGCGTGFNDKLLQTLKKRFSDLENKKMPFRKKPAGKQIHWLKPELVAEVKFAELTQDGNLRSPVFMRLRDDKKPSDCTLRDLKRDVQVEEIQERKKKAKSIAMSTKKEKDAGDKRKAALESASNLSDDKPVKRRSVTDKSPRKPEFPRADVIDLQSRRQDKMRSSEKEGIGPGKRYPVDPAVVRALEEAEGVNKLTIEVEGNPISFTNLDKTFWPATGEHPALTKRDFALYLCRVAPWLIPHSMDRPITLVRFPHGINDKKFYQKHWDKGLPNFVETVWIYGEHAAGDQRYMVCNNLCTLLWLAQIADLELHTWQSRTSLEPDARALAKSFSGSVENLESSVLNYPDYLLFDLDPYIYSGKEKTGAEPELNIEAFKTTTKLAKWLKEVLDTLNIEAFIKTTGKTGLHLYIPLVREFNFDEVRAISEAIGRAVMAKHPNDVTMEWAVVKRTGKIFLDHNMNARGKTLASIYSPRVSPEAAVSMPIRWEDIDDVYPTDFTMRSVPQLLAQNGDLWADILDHKNNLRQLLGHEPGAGRAPKSKRRKSS